MEQRIAELEKVVKIQQDKIQQLQDRLNERPIALKRNPSNTNAEVEKVLKLKQRLKEQYKKTIRDITAKVYEQTGLQLLVHNNNVILRASRK